MTSDRKPAEEPSGWPAVRGRPGRLAMVPKGDLRVDPAYQRQVKTSRVNEIARDFDWARFGVLLVAEREDGSLVIEDGQHRWEAAMLRPSIAKLPCSITKASCLKEEAAAFVGVNKDRSAVPAIDLHRANVVREDPDSMAVREVLARTGYEIKTYSGPRSVSFVNKLLAEYRRDPTHMERVWGLCVHLAAQPSNTAAINDRVFLGLSRAERHLARFKETLLEGDGCEKVMMAGIAGILSRIKSREIKLDKGGVAVWADAVIEIVNHKKRRRVPYISAEE